jgi:hypothetical protein
MAQAQSATGQPSVEACAQAYSAGQEERLKGNRLEAIERFAVCAAASCPGVVVQDCSRWLTEVQAELASVRFVIRDHGGQRLESVDVYLDNEAVTLGSDGTALVPPGKHEFRFEAPAHYPATVERSLRVGERDAVINVLLAPVTGPAPQDDAQARSSGAQPGKDQPSGGGVPPASIIVGSLGVVALGVAVGFGVSAGSDYRALEKECAPDCTSGQASSVSRKTMIADVALVTGAVALGAALWIYFDRDDSRGVALGVAPTPTGPQGRLRASF